MTIFIRKADEQDFDAIWEIFHKVVADADTYTYDPNTTKEQAYAIWMPVAKEKKETYVAVLDNEIVGTYLMKPNQAMLGAHVANVGYMVHSAKQGLGIGRAMAEHSLIEAKKLGYRAMQYNIVVSTNTGAVQLWQKLGFKIIGTTPEGFKHPTKGFVDTYIMYRFLD